MNPFTAQQCRHLKWAAQAGILSSSLVADALSWGRPQVANWVPVPPEPVRPRRSRELNAKLLGIQISRRELELLLEVPFSTEIARQVRIKRLHIALLETAYETMSGTGVASVAPIVSQPDPIQDVPLLDLGQRTQRDAVLEALGIVEVISSIAAALESQKTPTSHSPIHTFGIIDATLCMAWLDFQLDESVEFWAGVCSVEKYSRCLVYSARTAELAALSYYRALGHIVEDVSAQQLEGKSKDWVTFDIRASNRCIDVKNARQALHGPGHFVKHCVPRFKTDRTSLQDVAILGVLSDYRSSPDDYVKSLQTVTVLGEVTIQDLRGIYRWARARFGNGLDLEGLWKPQYVSGWLFEYPDEHYVGRSSAIQAVQPQLRRMKDAGCTGNEVPGWMLVLCKADSVIAEFEMDEARRVLVNELRAIQIAVGLNRRSLYVYAMGLTLECLSHKTAPGEILARLLSILKIGMPWGSESTLLGLRDPQSYVEHLIETLTEIGQAAIERGLELTGFKLTHPAILLGIESSGRTSTLLAYCGGWQSQPFKAQCGNAPLTLARHSSCAVCGHLICDNCGHCANNCPACQTRQEKIVEASSNSSAETELTPF